MGTAWIGDDPNPVYSRLDRFDGLRDAENIVRISRGTSVHVERAESAGVVDDVLFPPYAPRRAVPARVVPPRHARRHRSKVAIAAAGLTGVDVALLVGLFFLLDVIGRAS